MCDPCLHPGLIDCGLCSGGIWSSGAPRARFQSTPRAPRLSCFRYPAPGARSEDNVEKLKAVYRTAQPGRAVAPLQKAVSLDRKDAQPHLYLGLSYFDLGNYLEALKEVQEANRLPPKDVDVLYTLGQVYGKLMSATYIKLAEVDPDSYRVHQVLGESYQAQKNTEKATAEFRKALDLNPNALELQLFTWRRLLPGGKI
jgi:tetratricopeptide (TPR) repeat protein